MDNLKNKYYLMRHGRSLANEAGLIVSRSENGVNGYGLAPRGKDQIQDSLEQQTELGPRTRIITSDFLRTRESAELAASILGSDPPRTTPLLRERNFGNYELTPDANYNKVWVEDAKSDDADAEGVETTAQVRKRFQKLIASLEEEFEGEQILLVSHGDILQIALTWPAGCASREHRSLRHLETAEIRAFNPQP